MVNEISKLVQVIQKGLANILVYFLYIVASCLFLNDECNKKQKSSNLKSSTSAFVIAQTQNKYVLMFFSDKSIHGLLVVNSALNAY